MLTTIAERVRQTRELRGLTQMDLARLGHIQQTTVSRIESGEIQQPSSASMASLATALGVSCDYLINGGQQIESAAPFDTTASTVLCTFIQAEQWGDPDSIAAFLAAVEVWKSQRGVS